MSAHEYWTVALLIGLVAALIVATLLVMLVRTVGSIETVGRRPARGRAPGSPATRRTSRSSRRPRRCWRMIVDEAVVQDGYMNALTDGFGET